MTNIETEPTVWINDPAGGVEFPEETKPPTRYGPKYTGHPEPLSDLFGVKVDQDTYDRLTSLGSILSEREDRRIGRAEVVRRGIEQWMANREDLSPVWPTPTRRVIGLRISERQREALVAEQARLAAQDIHVGFNDCVRIIATRTALGLS